MYYRVLSVPLNRAFQSSLVHVHLYQIDLLGRSRPVRMQVVAWQSGEGGEMSVVEVDGKKVKSAETRKIGEFT